MIRIINFTVGKEYQISNIKISTGAVKRRMLIVESVLRVVETVLLIVDAFLFLGGVVEVDHHELLDVQTFYLLYEFLIH